MGLFSSLAGIAAPIAGSFLGSPALGAALGGALAGSGGGPKSMTSTQQQQLDPRIASMLFGTDGSGKSGLLGRFQSLLDQPQTLGSQVAGNLSSNYLAGALPDDVTAIRNASLGLINSQAPGRQFDSPDFNNPNWITTPKMQAAQVNAPSQNNLDLAPAYQNFIYGDSASDPRLNRALQSGINQSNQAFQTQLGNINDNLQRNVLPGIRGGAIASGTYGGSRQGIAEGLALSDLNKQATNAAQQLGLANIAATTGAQANAYESGQNRALSALSGLGAQQYGVAQQNAQLQADAARSNMMADLEAQRANQASGNQAALANQNARLATNQLNSQNALAANSQNNAARIAGLGSLSGLGNQLYGYNQNAQNADLLRAQGVSGLLAPFIGANSSSTNTQPLYQNQGANLLGGAAAGLGLYNQFSNLFKS